MHWYDIRNEKGSNTANISIYEHIGADGCKGKQFIDDLNRLDVSEIFLTINSPGGSVFDGMAIYHALKKHKATITVEVAGLAASISSVIMCAGDTVLMPQNALIMVHLPSALALGNAGDMRKMADTLDKIGSSIVAVYAGRTGKPHAELLRLMEAETWFSADEALQAGFCDEILEPVRLAACHDLSSFKNAPMANGGDVDFMRLVTKKAQQQGLSIAAAMPLVIAEKPLIYEQFLASAQGQNYL